jgi:TP901 family phage tail tape measure protein
MCADIAKTVEIIFAGKNELSKTIGGIEREFGQLDDFVSKIAAPLAGVADSILKVDAALAALAIGGIALAVRETGTFNNTFGEITTLIGATGAPIDKFRNDILNYSGSSVKSLEEINKALYASISAGIDYTKSLEFMTVAEKLAVAGLAPLGVTTRALVSNLNAYGASTGEATKYSDIMFTTVRLGQTTLSELSVQLAKVTGLAASSGVPFETLSAAVAALTVSGLPTEQALTGIKAALSNIVKPSGEAETMAKALGIQFNATALKTKGFEGVLWDAWRATMGSTTKMAELFGSVEALNAVLVLSSDKTGKFKESLKAMGAAGGATAEAYAKVANSFENVNQRLENSMKLTLISIGDKLMPQYGAIAGALGDFMKGIRVGVDEGAFDPLFKMFDEVSVAIGVWLKGVAKAFPDAMKMVDFGGLLTALQGLGDAFGSFLGDLDLTNASDLAAAIQLMIDGITGLINITSGMVDAFRPFFNQIGEFLIKMAQSDEETQKTIGSILLFAKAIQDAGLGVVLAIMAMQEFNVSIAGVFDSVAGGAQIMFNGLQILLTAIKSMFLIVEGAIIGLADKLTFGLLPSLGRMSEVIAEQGAAIMDSYVGNATIELNKLKLKALDRGDSQITVRADGLKPHLEMIMWEVLEAIQIRASASQAEFLLGYA